MIFEMVMGCPASGKTTYAKNRQLDDWVRISWEEVSTELKKSFPQASDKEVYIEMLQRAKTALRNKQHVIYDTNCLTAERRKEIINNIKLEFGNKVSLYLVYLQTRKELCLIRNNKRQRNIDQRIIEEAFEKIEPPLYSEGWDLIKTIQTTKES